jgi:uncharacterized membrane protein
MEVGVMLSAMKSLACVGTLLALSTPAAFAEQRDAQQKDAQQTECFTIAMTNATTGGSLGSILLDKCTGNSWVLARTRLGDGRETTRWFPLGVETAEIVIGGGPGSR